MKTPTYTRPTNQQAAREAGQPKTVTVVFHDGETIIERNVNEVHDNGESLFLRRYSDQGVEFDMCDIKSFSVA